MHGRTLGRLLLVTMLVAGMGLAAEATAVAGTATQLPAGGDQDGNGDGNGNDDKKKKKKRKPTVKLRERGDLGEILVDKKGRTLYLFVPDGEDTEESQCTDQCAEEWPPLTAKRLRVGNNLDEDLIDSNSDRHVSYNGHLLYRYADDDEKRDTNGQGIGGVWYVLDVDGEPVGLDDEDAETTTTTNPSSTGGTTESPPQTRFRGY